MAPEWILLAEASCCSLDATHLIAELIELIDIYDILVWINKVYIDILFFVCARNPIEMNFPQYIYTRSLSESVTSPTST